VIVVPVVSILSAAFFYLQALKNAMGAKRWGFLGLCFGPLIWPLFNTHKRLRTLRTRAQNEVFFA
jgi:hypothetical protein